MIKYNHINFNNYFRQEMKKHSCKLIVKMDINCLKKYL